MKSLAFLSCLLTTAFSTSPLRGAEEKELSLSMLQGHCQKMLALQTAVCNGTRNLNRSLAGKKPRPEDHQALFKLSKDASEIVTQAKKALDALEAEGSAVAVAEVFQELLKDAKRIQLRLKVGDVGPETQAIEQDVLDILKEMINAAERG